MKKTSKRIISILLAVLMLVSVLPAGMITAQAAIAELYYPVRDSKGNSIKSLSGTFSADHHGIDVGNSVGASWYAAYGGYIERIDRGCKCNGYGDHSKCNPNHGRYWNDYFGKNICNNSLGNGVIISSKINGTTYYFQYAHMNSVSNSLKEHTNISKGTYLGTVGDKGGSTAVHAHFEINRNKLFANYVNNDFTSKYCEFTYNFGKLTPNPPGKPGKPRASKYDVAKGDNVKISWDAVDTATGYQVIVDGNEKQNNSSREYNFKPDAKSYSVSITASNTGGKSKSSDSIRITGHNPSTVTFKDWDGTVITSQSVKYDYNAVAPSNPPSRKGYTFIGWDKSYNNVKSNLNVTALYNINTYTVKFLDKSGNLLKTEKVEYNQDATPPEDTKAPTGYEFVGWSSQDYKNVYTDAANKTITVQGIYKWSNERLPIVTTHQSAYRTADGYYVTFDLTNYPDAPTRGRAVVTLKTDAGKLVDTTESTAFRIGEDSTKKNIEVFVPCDFAATQAEVIVVDSYSSGVPISEIVTTSVDQGAMWSDWQDEDPGEQLEVQTRQEYRFRDKQFTTSTTSDTMDGWTKYNTTTSWSEYGNWSAWSKTAFTESDSRKVDTRTVTDKAAYTSYEYYNYWNWHGYGDGGDWIGFSKSGYTRQTSSSTSPYSYWGKDYGYNAYVKRDSKGNAVWVKQYGELWFLDKTVNHAAQTHKEYRYADRNLITTRHFYKWNDWSDWSVEAPLADSNREIEEKTVYRYIGGSGSENQGVNRVQTGTVDAALAGRQITLYVYGYIGASDFTNFYIGQSTIREDGSYRFTYRLRQEPSIATGDLTVAIGIEGTTDRMIVDTIEAPKPQHTVKFYDYDGEVIKESSVTDGDSISAPEIENRPGHTFVCWSESTTNVKSDLDVFPVDYINKYTVTYINWLDETVENREFEYGAKISAPVAPEVEGYTFKGWTGITDGETVITENMIVTAEYEKNTYTVQFLGIDEDDVIDTQMVEYGEAAEVPEDLSEGKLIHYGWQPTEYEADYTNVDRDMTVLPLYTFEETTPNPSSNVANGEYMEAQTVTLSVDDASAAIYYTTDDTDPRVSQTAQLYTAPIRISSTCTLQYYAASFEKNDSEIVKNYYCINDGQFSDWVTFAELPIAVKSNIANYEVESDTGYKYKNLEVAENLIQATTLLNQGWTFEKSQYTEYTPWQDEKIEIDDTYDGFEVDTRETDDPTVTWYQYSHYKYTDSNGDVQCSPTAVAGFDCEYETIKMATKLSTAGFLDGTTTSYYNYNGEKWFTQTKVNGVKVQYRSRHRVNVYYKWTNWLVDSLSPDETREYITDDVYRYANKDYHLVSVHIDEVYSHFASDTFGEETTQQSTLYQIVQTNSQINTDKYINYYEGYNFDGLYTDENCTQPYELTAPVTSSLELYANYTIKNFTVKFVMPDGTEIDTQQVDYMTAAEEPQIDEIPGWVFVGWDDTFDSITTDTVITAKYLAADKYATVSLDKTNCSLFENNTTLLQATVSPENLSEEKLIWTSDDTNIATVDDDGYIHAISPGTTTITVTVASSGEKASCAVLVAADVATNITLIPNSVLNYDSFGNLRRIKEKTAVSDIREQFVNENIVAFDANGDALAEDAYITNGTQIKLMAGNTVLDTVNTVITGDMTCDGIINNKDVVFAARVVVKKQAANDIQTLAMDVNGDGKVNNRDVAMLARYLVGKEQISN